ncbi:hypothetical protein V8E36_004206 [Tilletia maclaganii]
MAPREITSAGEFDQQLAAAGGKVVVVDFHATWCGPCHAIAPTFASLANKHAASAVFLKVNVDGVKEIAQRYSVRAMPTFAFIKNRSVVDTLKGADPGRLTQLVQKHAAASAASGAASSSRGPAAGSNVHRLGDIKNVQLENLLPLLLLAAYVVYILS